MEASFEGRLRAYRQRTGLTLGGLSARSGVSKATLSRWESGHHRPRLAELQNVLDALNVSARERALALDGLGTPEAARLLRLEDAPPPLTGDLIRALRLRRGLTQAEAARLVGATQSALARWEGGQSEPDPARRHAIAFALGALPEEAAALVAGRFEMGDGAGKTPEALLDHIDLTQVLFRHHPVRELRILAAGALAWRRVQETGDEGYAKAYRYALAFQALSHAEDGETARAAAEIEAYGGLPKGEGEPSIPGYFVAYADSVASRARGRKAAAFAALADAPGQPEDVRAWFASERAAIVEAGDPDRGLRLARQAFRLARAAREEDPGRDVDVFYRGHFLGSVLSRQGRLAEAREVFEEGAAVYGGLDAMRGSTLPDIAAYSVQHLMRLAEASLDGGDQESAEEGLAMARARIATMLHLRGHQRSLARLEDRFLQRALRVRA